jgi:hypothetical protein
VQQQQRQQSARLPSPERERDAVALNLDRTQEAELHDAYESTQASLFPGFCKAAAARSQGTDDEEDECDDVP